MNHLICMVLLLVPAQAACKCLINIDGLQDRSPVLLYNNDILNSESQFIEVDNNQEIQLLCTGTGNGFLSAQTMSASAICTRDEFQFDLATNVNDIHELLCRKTPESHARQIGKCNTDGALIEIGFDRDEEQFLTCILLCFNRDIAQTYWTKNYLKSSGYYWKQKTYKHFELDFLHSNIQPYSIYRQNRSLDKGHLSPKGDFYTAAEKRMTYYFINTAPQVKRFNNENWRKLEETIRQYAQNKRKNFHIYTGTHGNIRYLYNNYMPLPQFFWKVIIQEDTGKAVAFIGINDIEQTYANLCTDVCGQLHWLGNFQNERQNWQNGYVYCCKMESFMSIEDIKIPKFSEYRGGIP